MNQNTIVVTGGAGDGQGGASGRYIARKLAEQGFAVALWDIKDDAGEAAAEEICRAGRDAAYYHCDITDPQQVQQALEDTLRDHSQICGLVNNAFWHADRQPPLHEVSLADWDRHISINLRAHFIVCKYVIPELLKQSSSVIVNISSTGCHRGEHGYAAYSAAKAGLESLTRSIAAEYGRSGLRCNCVAAGLMLDRPVADMLRKIPDVAEGLQEMADKSLLDFGIMDGRAAADAVAFLVSEESRFMTGETIVIDGGTISHSAAWKPR
jgi:NAD(P)-dependent dehydrogenase (short-subunit alcohol dehydrogenase family)